MKKSLPWILTAALLIGAWFVQLLTPPEDAISAPFVISTQIGEQATGRDIEVTVTEVRAARRVTASNGWSAEGTWVLVDLDAASVRTQRATQLAGATLTVGDREFRASERMPSIFTPTGLVPGVPRSGTLAFELPGDALTGTATLHLSVREDTRVDSVIELLIALDELVVADDAPIRDTGWTNP